MLPNRNDLTRSPMRKLFFVPLLLLPLTACDLDLENPNAPTVEEVITDVDGLISLAIGMQGDFALQFEEFIQAPSLVTDEWGTGTRSLISYQTLFSEPANLDPGFGLVEEPFAAAYEVVDAANVLMANVPEVIQGEGLSTGIIALAKLFKGMALGMVALQYERAPIDITVEQPVPVLRVEVLDSVIAVLESARTDINSVTDDQLAGFRSRVVPEEFDIRTTIDAMLARYYLVRAGATGSTSDYAAAAAAAGRVDLTAVPSRFAYTGAAENPVYNLSVELEYVYPLLSFVEDAEPGDERPAFWVDVSATPFPGNPDSLLLPLNRYNTASDPIYVYLPDEMRLIQAEAAVRQNDFPTARNLINEVRTAGAAPFASLPALPVDALDTEEELLRQIAYERRYELYMQGLRWEDMRRLDPYIDTEPTIEWLPLPTQECTANPSAGC